MELLFELRTEEKGAATGKSGGVVAGSRRQRGLAQDCAGLSRAARGRGQTAEGVRQGEALGEGGLHLILSDTPTGRLAKERLDLSEFIFPFYM